MITVVVPVSAPCVALMRRPLITWLLMMVIVSFLVTVVLQVLTRCWVRLILLFDGVKVVPVTLSRVGRTSAPLLNFTLCFRLYLVCRLLLLPKVPKMLLMTICLRVCVVSRYRSRFVRTVSWLGWPWSFSLPVRLPAFTITFRSCGRVVTVGVPSTFSVALTTVYRGALLASLVMVLRLLGWSIPGISIVLVLAVKVVVLLWF